MRRLTCAKPLLCTAALQRDTSIYQRDWLCHQALGERADEGLWGRRQPRQHRGIELKAHAAAPSCWIGAGLGLHDQCLGCLVKAAAGKSRRLRVCECDLVTVRNQRGLQQAKMGAQTEIEPIS